MEDPIKKLFQKGFEEFTPPVDVNEWYACKTQLAKHNFLRFNLFQFNVYYAVCIATCFLLSIGTTLHYAYHFVHLTKEVPDPHSSVPSTPLAEEENIELPSSSSRLHNKENKRKKMNHQKADSSNIQSDGKQLPVNQIDTSYFSTTQPQPSSSSPSLNKEDLDSMVTKKTYTKRHKVIIPKQDTIHRFDTIKSKKVFWHKKE